MMFLFDMVILHCYINLGDCWIVKLAGVNIDVGNQWFQSENDRQMMGILPTLLRSFTGGYPLVICYIAIENGHL